jgi:hypothetical protein
VSTRSEHREQAWDEDEYSDMERLEWLESLREDMEELGVSTLQEIITRIEALHRKLDQRSI